MADDRGSFDLEVGVFPLQRLVFASQTHYQNGTLGINRAALLNAIAEPRVIADIEIHLAHPGESCRIVHVLDAVPVMVEGRRALDGVSRLFRPSHPCRRWPQSPSSWRRRAGVWHLSRSHQRCAVPGRSDHRYERTSGPILRLLRHRQCRPGVSSGIRGSPMPNSMPHCTAPS